MPLTLNLNPEPTLILFSLPDQLSAPTSTCTVPAYLLTCLLTYLLTYPLTYLPIPTKVIEADLISLPAYDAIKIGCTDVCVLCTVFPVEEVCHKETVGWRARVTKKKKCNKGKLLPLPLSPSSHPLSYSPSPLSLSLSSLSLSHTPVPVTHNPGPHHRPSLANAVRQLGEA